MADWDDSIDILENGTGSEQENANCWMRHPHVDLWRVSIDERHFALFDRGGMLM